MNKLLTLLATFVTVAFAGPDSSAPRPPAVAGQFYPADAKALGELVDGYLKAAASAPAQGLVALLVPHAGLEFSGATAAKAYALLKRGRWDSVIVVGTGHYKAVAGAALYPGAYASSEGAVPYDATLAEALLKASPLIVADAAAHEKEHSIEVQLPFLRRRLGEFKLVALVMNTEELEKARDVGRALAEAARGRRVLLVASSDQSHYPSAEDARAVDRTTLEALKTLDPSFFWQANRFLLQRGIPNLQVSYCGQAAVTAVVEAATRLGATEARVLARTNSGEAVPQAGRERVVGYAAVAFVKSPRPPARPTRLSESERKELLGLARRSAAAFIGKGETPSVGLSSDPRLNLPGAVFVTLTRAGALRGCIGTLEPRESLAESVAQNAVLAATADPRFPPMRADELSGARIEISVLSRPKPAAGAAEVRRGDGVILEKDGRSGVFLPQVWDHLPEKAAFLAELCSQKAGLPRDCYEDPGVRLRVFSAEAFEEGR